MAALRTFLCCFLVLVTVILTALFLVLETSSVNEPNESHQLDAALNPVKVRIDVKEQDVSKKANSLESLKLQSRTNSDTSQTSPPSSSRPDTGIAAGTTTSSQQLPPIGKLLGKQSSKYAYVTLLHGIDNTFAYRGYLYNALIMKKALASLGSTADFIVLVGFTTDGDFSVDYKLFAPDLALLTNERILLYYLPRLLPEKKKVSFAEMALLKISPWSFTSYERLQYMDGDVLPTKNMDCYFKFDTNTFNTGNASPLNSGWYLAVPDVAMFNKMKSSAIQRLKTPWNETGGWGTMLPEGVHFRGEGKAVTKWTFNGASLDQGLLFHTFALNAGNILLLDDKKAIKYSANYQKETVALKDALQCCAGRAPPSSFEHFTGQKKPWLQNLESTKSKALLLWKSSLDALKLPINSSNYRELGKKIPLGFWHPNK